jgi:hypothetical protein
MAETLLRDPARRDSAPEPSLQIAAAERRER